MILAFVYPLILGLDRLETASFLRSNGTFQYLTGLPSFPDPQTLRRCVKTQSEKFAGALQSYCIEAMMQNGFALQAGTSHDLGQNFGKAFDVQFRNKEGQLDYVWQTSCGVSTRLIGGLIMSHSDDRGLVLPPKLAPTKAVIVPIYGKDGEKDRVLEAAHRIAKEVGAKVDDREGQTPGAKFFHWERRGVPVVLEFGPRDLASGSIVLKLPCCNLGPACPLCCRYSFPACGREYRQPKSPYLCALRRKMQPTESDGITTVMISASRSAQRLG
jgi:hypothetical protein